MPPSENRLAIWFQIACVVAVLRVAFAVRSLRGAIALAALVPAVFLVTNRIFSPQYYVLVLAAIAVAAAPTVRRRAELLLLAAACAVATTANTVLFQSYLGSHPTATLPGWTYVSAVSLVPGAAVIAWLTARAFRSSPA